MKVLKLMAVAFLVGMSALVSTSCSGSDAIDGDGGEDVPTALVKYRLEGTNDFLSAVEIQAVYTNGDGKKEVVAIDRLPWEKIVTVRVPYSGTLTALYRKKPDFTVNKSKYSIGMGGYALYKYPTDQVWQGSVTVASPVECTASNVEAVIDRLISRMINKSVEIK